MGEKRSSRKDETVVIKVLIIGGGEEYKTTCAKGVYAVGQGTHKQ